MSTPNSNSTASPPPPASAAPIQSDSPPSPAAPLEESILPNVPPVLSPALSPVTAANDVVATKDAAALHRTPTPYPLVPENNIVSEQLAHQVSPLQSSETTTPTTPTSAQQ